MESTLHRPAPRRVSLVNVSRQVSPSTDTGCATTKESK